MKKFLHIALVIGAVGALMCSCEPEPKVDGVAEIKSFAITAAANEALSQDCVATIDNVASTIIVALPMDTEKSALVPTFTTTDGDVVTLNGEVVKSGETALDMSEPVELTVTDEASAASKNYTLTAVDNDGKAELLSVGFLAKNNEAKLKEDVVAEAIADEMVLRIAGGGAGVELVMSVEAGTNDVVTVNGAEAAGVATVDCTFPIDITVADPYAGVEKKYVVKVGKILQNAGWTEMVNVVKEFEVDEFNMAVDKVKDEVYISYLKTHTEGEGEAEVEISDRAVVEKWNGSALELVGAEDFTGGPSAWMDVAAHNGKLYAFISDKHAELTTASTPSMFAFDGSAWSALGTRGFGEKAATSHYTFTVNPANGYPIGVYQCNNSKSTTVPRRGAIYNEWDGSAMTTNVTIPVQGHEAAWYGYNPRLTTLGDVVYCLVHLQNLEKVVVYKLEKGAWSVVLNQFIPEGALKINTRDADVAVAANGDVFILIADDNVTNGTYMSQVYKVTAEGAVKVGSPLYDLDDGRKIAITTDTKNNPVVAYRTDSDDATKDGYVNVVSLDEDTQNWGEPFVVAVNTYVSDGIYLDNSENGTMYLTITENVSEDVEVDGKKDTIDKYRCIVYKNALEADVLPE